MKMIFVTLIALFLGLLVGALLGAVFYGSSLEKKNKEKLAVFELSDSVKSLSDIRENKQDSLTSFFETRIEETLGSFAQKGPKKLSKNERKAVVDAKKYLKKNPLSKYNAPDDEKMINALLDAVD